MAARYWLNAVAKNHAPINVLTRTFGLSLVIVDNPTGDKHNSPVVCSKMPSVNQLIATIPTSVQF